MQFTENQHGPNKPIEDNLVIADFEKSLFIFVMKERDVISSERAEKPSLSGAFMRAVVNQR